MEEQTIYFNGLRIELYVMDDGSLGITVDKGNDSGGWCDICVDRNTLEVSTDSLKQE